MSIPSLPVTLTPPLTSREAIADTIYRCVVALDTNNPTLFKSAFTDDATFEINGKVTNGLDAINTDCYEPISKLDTTHFVTNVRVNILDEDSKAEVTCSALSQHYRGGEGLKGDSVPFLTGSLYWAEVVKDAGGDGLWKSKNFKMRLTWGQGDRGVVGKSDR